MKACKTERGKKKKHALGRRAEALDEAGGGTFTFPKMGRSTDPHVSAPQWTSPEAKSAVSIPATVNEGGNTAEQRRQPRERLRFRATPTDTQQEEPRVAQVEVGKQVNEVEGHEREAEDDAQPLLESFAWGRQKNPD